MSTATIRFARFLRSCVDNHCVYLWGAQGEKVLTANVNKIVKAESTSSTDPKTARRNAQRVLTFIANAVMAGYDMSKAQFFDCSGLITYYAVENGFIKSDTTAEGLRQKCDAIGVRDLKRGDLCFKMSKDGRATHVAGVVEVKKNGDVYIVEAKGRDDGVVEHKLIKENGFSAYGRPRWWAELKEKEKTS